MSLQVVSDFVGGSMELNRDQPDTTTRLFLVTGLRTTGRTRLAKVYSAPGIPGPRQRHPVQGFRHMTVVSRRVETYQGNPDAALVTVVYSSVEPPLEETGEPSVSWSVEYATDTTIHDARGRLMIVSYSSSSTGITGGSGLPSTTLTTNVQVARVEVERTVATARISRLLDEDAERFLQKYADTTNRTRWSGYAPNRVRCRGFTSTPTQDGRHQVEGIFTIAPDPDRGWKVQGVTEVESAIPVDANEGNGLRTFRIYPTADFNRSGFYIP